MAPPPSHSQSLLPGPGTLILDRVERDADRFRLVVHVEQEPVCPLCGEASRSRHSSYCRHLQDLPWQGVSVQLWATVGRYRCRNPACSRKIFCERLRRIMRVYAGNAHSLHRIPHRNGPSKNAFPVTFSGVSPLWRSQNAPRMPFQKLKVSEQQS